MNWAYLLNGFHGRIGRQSFWIAMTAVIVINVLACFVASQIAGERVSAIIDLAFTYPEFAIALKRSYDRNLPVWFIGAFFVANGVLDLLDVLGWSGTPDNIDMLTLAITVPFTVLALALLVELGFRRGTVGPNQHGPDPLARS
jgi:uncharacterized membrane protein YhaH (DUF805 family)